MRNRIGKLGFICLALIIALGSTGVGYAYWSDTLTIEGEVETGELDWRLEDYCCWCLCAPCDCKGDADCKSDFAQIEQELASSLDQESLDGLFDKLDPDKPSRLDLSDLSHNLAPDEQHKSGCKCLNDCHIEGIDSDSDGDIDKLVIKCSSKCCTGILGFTIRNSGTIPLKISNVNCRGFSCLEVHVVSNPVGEQLDPGEEADAIYLWAGRLNNSDYQFEVTVDADYWNTSS